MGDTITLERDGRVAMVRFHRPQALNALNLAVIDVLNTTLAPLDADDVVGCIIVTGSEKAFAAEGDVKKMPERSAREVALMWDILIAAENARFGQSESGSASSRAWADRSA